MQDRPTLEMIEIPESVHDALLVWAQRHGVAGNLEAHRNAVKVALLSLATNPVRLQREIAQEVAHGYNNQYSSRDINEVENAFVEFQRIAFLKRGPEVPEEVKALMWSDGFMGNHGTAVKKHNADIIAAYKAGREARNA